MNPKQEIITNLRNWINEINNNITILVNYEKKYSMINTAVLLMLAVITSILGALESMSLVVEITEGETNWAFIVSVIKLTLIAFSAGLSSIIVTVNPSKKAKDSHKGAKDFTVLSRTLTSKINKIYVSDESDKELIDSYNKLLNKYLEIELNIIENTPINYQPLNNTSVLSNTNLNV